MPVQKSYKRDTWFISILLLVHIIGFMLACNYTRIYMGDSMEYIYEAINIKQHFFFYSGSPSLPVTEEYMTQRQPGYPFFLLLVYMFSINNWIVLALQNILSIVNIYIARNMLLKLGYNSKYDWLLLLFIITYPAQIIYANTIAPDILLQTFTVLYLYHFIMLVKEKRSRHAFYMSLSLIAGLFVKPVLYPFSVVHILTLAVFAVYNKRKVANVTFAALLPVCAVLLYNTWNYERTGKFHFSSNQAFNAIFYYYLFDRVHEGAGKAEIFLHDERSKIEAMPRFKDRYDYANARGTSLLKSHLIPYSLFHAKNSLRFFIEPGKGEIDLFTGKLTYGRLYDPQSIGFYATLKEKGITGIDEYIRNNRSMVIVAIVLLFNCIRVLGMGLFLFSKRIPSPIRLFLLLFMCYFAATTGPIANTRYFLPLSLLVSGCAVIGYQYWQEKKHKPVTKHIGDY